MASDIELAESLNSQEIYDCLAAEPKEKEIFQLTDLINNTPENMYWSECLSLAEFNITEARRMFYEYDYSFVCRLRAIKLSINYMSKENEYGK